MGYRRRLTTVVAAALAGLTAAALVEAPAYSASPATAAAPSAAPAADRSTAGTDDGSAALLPDLAPLRAEDVSIQVLGDTRKIRFASSLANLGPGPLEVRPNRNMPCPPGQHNSTQIIFTDANNNQTFNRARDTEFTRHRAGCMVYHPYHDHWHFKASARYTLLDPRAEEEPVVVTARRKVSFCLRDSARVPTSYGTWDYPESYLRCTKKSPQGISVGWMDIYQSFLAGQSLTLPRRLEDGVYCLRTVVDPLDQLAESDNDNNASMKALKIKGNRVLPRKPRLCR
jgi:hypothetical protein